MIMSEQTILRNGDLAYYVVGLYGTLIPCKIIGADTYNAVFGKRVGVGVQLTATRGAYKRGEYLVTGEDSVISRVGVHRRRNGGWYTSVGRAKFDLADV